MEKIHLRWRRAFLSAILIGACIWCLGAVREARSLESNHIKNNPAGYTQRVDFNDSPSK